MVYRSTISLDVDYLRAPWITSGFSSNCFWSTFSIYITLIELKSFTVRISHMSNIVRHAKSIEIWSWIDEINDDLLILAIAVFFPSWYMYQTQNSWLVILKCIRVMSKPWLSVCMLWSICSRLSNVASRIMMSITPVWLPFCCQHLQINFSNRDYIIRIYKWIKEDKKIFSMF